MKLVLIHGRSQQKKDPVKLQESWEDALDQGLRAAGVSRPKDLEIAFPYYGDTLADLVERVSGPPPANVTLRGTPPPDNQKQMVFQAEALYAMARSYGITDDEISACYDGAVNEKGPLNWEWVQAILRALDRTPLGATTLDTFTRDVYVYLSYPNVRSAINALVAAAIPDEPCVVLGHSLGTVVGYNVLSVTRSRVAAYITVGSPLGVNAVRRLVHSPLAMPPTTGGWFNYYDPRDVVALRALDATNFPIDPAITNRDHVDNDTDNRHGISGYLKDKEVAAKIHSALSELVPSTA
jgi:hypothetical protein